MTLAGKIAANGARLYLGWRLDLQVDEYDDSYA